jgi:hypothetical protein
MLNMPNYDAQSAHAFMISQASHIETEVYKARYPAIRYPSLIPVDTSAHPWVPSITYFSMDHVGKAAWINGAASDIPHADITRDKFETTVSMAGIGFGFDIQEVGQAQLLGQNLSASKGMAARRVAEEFTDNIALFGDASKGMSGLVNTATVTDGDAAATGTGSATEWSTKTPQNVLADINAVLSGIFTDTNTTALADTILVPYTQLHDIGQRLLHTNSDKTILDFVVEKNAYTMETGLPLTIRGVRGLETAGQGSVARLVAYRRSPEVLTLHMPLPFQFLPLWQSGPTTWEVPGILRLGGLDVRLPREMRYLDGI